MTKKVAAELSKAFSDERDLLLRLWAREFEPGRESTREYMTREWARDIDALADIQKQIFERLYIKG